MTPSYDAARKWAQKPGRNKGFVSKFWFDNEAAIKNGIIIKIFRRPDREWITFVLNCRMGIPHGYDLVIGPIADSSTNALVEDYINGILSFEQFALKLKPLKLNGSIDIQYAFCTEKALKHLHYIKK